MQNLPGLGLAPISISIWLVAAALTGCASTTETNDATDSDPDLARPAIGAGSDLGPPLPRPTGGKGFKTLSATEGLTFHENAVVADADWTAAVEEPERALALVAEGDELLRTVQRDEALAAYVEAVRLAPREAVAYEGLGRALLRVKRPEDALAAFRTARELDPERISVQREEAMTLERLGKLVQAEAAWAEVLRLAPDDEDALARRAIVLHFMGEDGEARRAVAEAQARGARVPPQLMDLLGLNLRAERPSALEGVRAPVVGGQVRVPSPDFPVQAYAVETSVAASAANPDHVLTVWTDAQSGSKRTSRVAVGESLDGGLTWDSHILEAPASIATNRQGDPMSAFDHRTGNLWVGGVTLGNADKNGIFVARRRPVADGVGEFDEPVVAWRAAGVDKPWMAAGPDPSNPEATRLYLVHTLGLQVSEDLGSTWTEPVPMEGFLGVQPRVGPNGELYVIYWDADDGILLHRSLDGGRTLEGPIPVARRLDLWDSGDGSRFPGSFRVPPFTYLAVSPVDGRLAAVWFDTTEVTGSERNVDLYVAHSDDQGTTWSNPQLLLGAQPVDGDQFFPWIEYDAEGGLHAVFYDTRHRDQRDADAVAWIDAYYAYSPDGRAWSQQRLTDRPFASEGTWYGGQFLGDYNGLAVAGTRAYPFYSSSQDGESDVYVHTVDRAPVGNGNGPKTLLPNDSPCLTTGSLCAAPGF